MSFLSGHRVLVFESASCSALPRFFASLGASVQDVSITDLDAHLPEALHFWWKSWA